MNARVSRPFSVSGPALALFVSLSTSAPGAPGDVDPDFHITYQTRPVYFAVPQANGKIMTGGGDGVTGSVILRRLQADGTPDPSLTTVPDDTVWGVTCLPDGQYLLYGQFKKVGSESIFYFDKIQANGVSDSLFTGSLGDNPMCAALQSDGRILAGGSFTTANGVTRNELARFTATGGLDAFNPNVTSGVVSGIVVQPDGKIIIAGSFSRVGGVLRSRIARLTPEGALDTAFAPTLAFDVYGGVLLQPDGKIILGRGLATSGMGRLFPDGTRDPSYFPPSAGEVNSMALQTDGKVIIGQNWVGMNSIRRFNANGTLDTGFNVPSAFAFNNIRSVFLQADGKLIAGGDFRDPNDTLLGAAVRFLNTPATQSLEVPQPSRVVWMRGGSSPEATMVSFEVSPPGSNTWTLLGWGTRIAGGWERTGLSLPVTGQIRARAYTMGGFNCGSVSYVETIAPFANYSPLQAWRVAHFGTHESTGPAADNADPDNDGLENLIEYAFAKNPAVPDAAGLPAWENDDDVYVLTFTPPQGVSGVTYIAEYSTTLQPQSWIPAPNAGTAPNFVFYAVAPAERFYLRLRVTAP